VEGAGRDAERLIHSSAPSGRVIEVLAILFLYLLASILQGPSHSISGFRRSGSPRRHWLLTGQVQSGTGLVATEPTAPGVGLRHWRAVSRPRRHLPSRVRVVSRVVSQVRHRRSDRRMAQGCWPWPGAMEDGRRLREVGQQLRVDSVRTPRRPPRATRRRRCARTAPGGRAGPIVRGQKTRR
jgi:hypothetical protein